MILRDIINANDQHATSWRMTNGANLANDDDQ